MFNAATTKVDRCKTIFYLLFLLTVSTTLCFYRLGDYNLQNDEALYARVVNDMLATGNWLYPQAYGEPYTHKPPLYFWLTAMTAHMTSDELIRYRLWSALFGIACTLLTFYLGRAMLSAEIGFIAALMLCMNESFLFFHSMREGTMESTLTFLALAAVFALWKLPSQGNPSHGWIIIGVAAGLMCMLKPLLGFMVLLPLIIHWQLFDAASNWKVRLSGPLLALLVCVLIFVPWHLLQWLQLGSEYFSSAFKANIFDRMTVGIDSRHVEGPLYYWIQTSNSSSMFILFTPSLLMTLIWSRFGNNKRAFGLLAVTILFWMVGFSLSSSKRLWYIFPIFPLIALSIAASIVAVAARLQKSLFGPKQNSKLPIAAMALVCCLAFGNWLTLLMNSIPTNIDRLQSVPLVLYQSVGPDRIKGLRFVIYDPPGSNWNHTTTYYYPKLSAALYVHSLSELADLLHEEQPTILIFNDDCADSLVQSLAARFCSRSCTWLRGNWGSALLRKVDSELPPGLDRWVYEKH